MTINIQIDNTRPPELHSEVHGTRLFARLDAFIHADAEGGLGKKVATYALKAFAIIPYAFIGLADAAIYAHRLTKEEEEKSKLGELARAFFHWQPELPALEMLAIRHEHGTPILGGQALDNSAKAIHGNMEKFNALLDARAKRDAQNALNHEDLQESIDALLYDPTIYANVPEVERATLKGEIAAMYGEKLFHAFLPKMADAFVQRLAAGDVPSKKELTKAVHDFSNVFGANSKETLKLLFEAMGQNAALPESIDIKRVRDHLDNGIYDALTRATLVFRETVAASRAAQAELTTPEQCFNWSIEALRQEGERLENREEPKYRREEHKRLTDIAKIALEQWRGEEPMPRDSLTALREIALVSYAQDLTSDIAALNEKALAVQCLEIKAHENTLFGNRLLGLAKKQPIANPEIDPMVLKEPLTFVTQRLAEQLGRGDPTVAKLAELLSPEERLEALPTPAAPDLLDDEAVFDL